MATTTEEPNKCYICFDGESEQCKFMDPNLCACRGSIKIHNHCLFELLTNKEEKTTCNICKIFYTFPDGPFKWYYSNGLVAAEGNYGNSMYQGLWKFYYLHGTLRCEQVWKDNIPNGLSKHYSPGGELYSEQIYENGTKAGVWKFYYHNGSVRSEETYKNGKKEGICKYYHDCGLLYHELVYRNDVVIYRKVHYDIISPSA